MSSSPAVPLVRQVSREFGLSPIDKIRAAKSCVPGWSAYPDSNFDIAKLTGGLTNLLTVVRLKKEKDKEGVAAGQDKRMRVNEHHHHHHEERAVLVREYGAGSDRFMNRVQEAKIIHALSEARLCPKVFGLKPWGRVEKFLHHARPLTTEEYRSDRFVPLVAELLGSFHSKSEELLKLCTTPGTHSVLPRRLELWYDLAAAVSFTPTVDVGVPDSIMERNARKLACLNVPSLREEIRWLVDEAIPMVNSPIVFCHNDLQEGNILLDDDNNGEEGSSFEQQQVSLNMIDLEYADRMERGFDFGNCFCEQAICYKVDNFPGFVLHPDHYPSKASQELFMQAYCAGVGIQATDDMIKQLLREARVFALASHLHWVIWSIIMASNSSIEFGYLEYAMQRLDQYRIGKDKLIKEGMQF